MFPAGVMLSQADASDLLRPTSLEIQDPEVNYPPELLSPDHPFHEASNPHTSMRATIATPSEDDFAVSSPSAHSTSQASSSPVLEFQSRSRAGRRMVIEDSETEDSGDGEYNEGDTSPHSEEVQLRSKNLIAMPLKELVYPKSLYGGYQPPFSLRKERIAVEELRKEISRAPSPIYEDEFMTDDNGFEEILLSNFSIYHPPSSVHRPFELQGLQNLTLHGNSCYMFDGVLSVGENRRYVERIAFEICSVGHYGPEHHEVGSAIWIQSNFSSGKDLFYKLGTPSTEYARFHEGFLWLANLAKHFVDYCHASKDNVSIGNFRSDFSRWMQESHATSIEFQIWYGRYNSADFRQAVSRNIEFLFKESIGVDEKLRSQPIWGELLVQDSRILKSNPILETKTVVTPYVYRCFSHLRFGSHLKAVEPANKVKSQQNLLSNALHLTNSTLVDVQVEMSDSEPVKSQDWQPQLKGMVHDTSHELELKINSISRGDVISVPLDSGGAWKDEVSPWKSADTCWYLLVQEVITSRSGEKSFNGLWLYAPSQTLCAKMKYPHPNELFLSDNCNCGCSRSDRITVDQILDVMPVNWYGQPTSADEMLHIRQTYLENERFVDLQDEHMTCVHFKEKTGQSAPKDLLSYSIGQTVLAHPLARQKSKFDLEVYEIINCFEQDNSQRVILRHLRRRSDFDAGGSPNELVYTDIEDEMLETRVYSECMVRFFDEMSQIPAPYNRGGAGNVFYITQKRIVEEDGSIKLAPLKTHPTSLIQSFDPYLPQEKPLRGLDLYCGGGNFGRGLEEGGVVEHSVAVDLDKAAIHTYNANLRPGSKTQMFFGSVDDLLNAAIRGNPRKLKAVPLPGDIDFISAGSPCQGFSLLNTNKTNEKSMKNQSLVASVAAYIDVYRPSYGLLENVISMAQKGKGRDEDVLSQLICAVVGMGYQTQIILLDAWSSGSPQSRSRLFLSFAAPGMKPLDVPALSHSHPPGMKQRSLGMLANGQPFGSRNLKILTPFKYVSIDESSRDLPIIGDGMTGHCTQFPDHILKETTTESIRRQIQAIPRYPRGMNFAKAWCDEKSRTMSKEDRLFFPSERTEEEKPRDCVLVGSKGWHRVHPDDLISTITVSPQYHNARGGSTIHWDEQRSISLMEYRRGQTYPDDEILVGTRAKGIKIIGNSVARSVAISFGLKLREAWLNTNPENNATAIAAKSSQPLPAKTCLPLSNPSKAFPSFPNTKPIEMPDSSETSNDEGYTSVPIDQENTPLKSKRLTPHGKIADDLVKQVKSLKRPRSSTQNIGASQGRAPKAPKLIAQPVTTAQVIIRSNNKSTSQPVMLLAKAPSISRAKTVIDLTNDSEDEISIVNDFPASRAGSASKATTTPYKAVDNSLFNAYAQTNTFMGYDSQRKHGPIRK